MHTAEIWVSLEGSFLLWIWMVNDGISDGMSNIWGVRQGRYDCIY